jgi:hypothetical protein
VDDEGSSSGSNIFDAAACESGAVLSQAKYSQFGNDGM